MFYIGDFARAGRVSVRILRHYDAIGLLEPAHVGDNGYRFYDAGQLERLNRIVALKDLGFTLEAVGVLLDKQLDAAELRGMLRLRREELRQQISADSVRLAQVEARLRIIESEGVMPHTTVTIKALPALHLAELTGTAAGFEPGAISPVIQPLYEELVQRLTDAGATMTGPAVAWYEQHDDGTVLVHAGAQVAPGTASDGVFALVDLPAVEQAATLIHRGSMDEVMPSVQALAGWIEANGYVARGNSREFYLDYAMNEDPASWVTELQEPVARA
ncbi:MerR family transcriptional regulator [Arthrobacter sp. 35W]|uniref:MerR family transcriptional regulator n=1 Tax=Arthrobacter sp. 35W TaxID=1132441 RepID=UPI00040D7A60|nr:MerR family transcriptional regulator [Arthrobacter sp. 35W]